MNLAYVQEQIAQILILETFSDYNHIGRSSKWLRFFYDIWNEIIYDVIEIHSPFLDAMKTAAKNLNVSNDVVNELKRVGFKEIQEK